MNRFLFVLIGAASILRIFICFQHNPETCLFSDPLRHWLAGQRIFSPDLMGASDPILYQVYIFLLRAFTHDNSFLVALVCALVSVFMPWTYYRASRELGMSRNASLTVWALIAAVPSLFVIYHYTMMETLLLPLTGIAIWVSGRHLRKGGTGSFLLSVLCWLLACLTKPIVVPLAGICLFWTWWMKSRRFTDGVLALGLAILLLLPNTLRTERYLGFAAPLGNSWLTRIQHRSGTKTIHIDFDKGSWSFSSPSCYIQPLAPLSQWVMARALTDSSIEIHIESSHGVSDWKSDYDGLRVGWHDWFLQMGENALLFLFAPSWPDSNRHEWDGWLSYMSRWMWAPLIFFVFQCNIRQFLARQFDLLPVAITVFMLFLVLQNVVTSEGRYRKSLEPLLLMNLVWAVSLPERKTKYV